MLLKYQPGMSPAGHQQFLLCRQSFHCAERSWCDSSRQIQPRVLLDDQHRWWWPCCCGFHGVSVVVSHRPSAIGRRCWWFWRQWNFHRGCFSSGFLLRFLLLSISRFLDCYVCVLYFWVLFRISVIQISAILISADQISAILINAILINVICWNMMKFKWMWFKWMRFIWDLMIRSI